LVKVLEREASTTAVLALRKAVKLASSSAEFVQDIPSDKTRRRLGSREWFNGEKRVLLLKLREIFFHSGHLGFYLMEKLVGRADWSKDMGKR